MRALSVKQPFAELIANGTKKKELRTSSRSCFRDMLIVASKTMHEDADEYEGEYDPKRLVFGQAVCVVDFFKVTGVDGDYAWHVRRPRRGRPFDVKGSASLYHVDDALIRFTDGSVGSSPEKRPRAAKTKRRPAARAIPAFVTDADTVESDDDDLRVVLADDDGSRRDRFARRLTAAGVEVDEVANAEAAWRALTTTRATTLIVSAALRGGVELLSRARGDRTLSATRVYLIGDRAGLRGLPADGVLVEPRDVARVIRRTIPEMLTRRHEHG